MGKKKDKIKAEAPVTDDLSDDLSTDAPVETHDEDGNQTTPPEVEEVTPNEPVIQYGDALVPLLHRLLDTVNTKTAIPAIHEVCSCGAMVIISDKMPEADRKRIHNAWLRRHKPCGVTVPAE